MKRLKLILPLLLILTLLSGCGWLDEMRSQHAIYYADGIIQYNGALYKQVNEEENEWFSMTSVDRDKDLYITAPDVPVLLSQSQIIKHQPYINAEHTVICDAIGDFYVLEQHYDTILAKAEKEATHAENVS
ncbi:MAG: hypothetical protein IKM48_04555 [Clostridia bacterium]|nr:hypothetical protein [Clostridia bacterium]